MPVLQKRRCSRESTRNLRRNCMKHLLIRIIKRGQLLPLIFPHWFYSEVITISEVCLCLPCCAGNRHHLLPLQLALLVSQVYSQAKRLGLHYKRALQSIQVKILSMLRLIVCHFWLSVILICHIAVGPSILSTNGSNSTSSINSTASSNSNGSTNNNKGESGNQKKQQQSSSKNKKKNNINSGMEDSKGCVFLLLL